MVSCRSFACLSPTWLRTPKAAHCIDIRFKLCSTYVQIGQKSNHNRSKSIMCAELMLSELTVLMRAELNDIPGSDIIEHKFRGAFFELGIDHQRQSKQAPCCCNGWFIKYWSQIRIEMISKSTQHFIDIRFKLCSNYIQIGQKSVQNRSQIGPTSVQNRSKIVQIGSLKSSWSIRDSSWGPRWPQDRFSDDFEGPLGVTLRSLKKKMRHFSDRFLDCFLIEFWLILGVIVEGRLVKIMIDAKNAGPWKT